MRSYNKKVKRCKRKGLPLYRTARQSAKTRQFKKLVGSKSWYRMRRRSLEEEDRQAPSDRRMPRVPREAEIAREEDEKLETRSVIFVEYTPGGILAKRLREVIRRLQGLLECQIKVVERTGLALGRSFPLTRLWDGVPCDREDCVTCTQGG